MDGEHRYEINLKKDDLFINLSSDDVYFISKQMDKWCHILLDDSYVPVSLPSSTQNAPKPSALPVQSAPPPPAPPVYDQVYVAPPPPPEYYPPQQPVYAQPMQPPPGYAPQQPVAYPPQQAYQQPAPVYAQAPPPVYEQPAQYYAPQAPVQQHAQPALTPAPSPMAQPMPPQPQPLPEAAPPVVQAPPAPAPVPQPIPQAAEPVLPPSPPPPAPLPANSELGLNDFEAVMDTLMKDFEDEAPLVDNKIEVNVPSFIPETIARPATNGNGVAQAEAGTVTSLLELCDRAQAGTSEDYLLLSAYYLAQFEKLDKFSLKKVNAMLVKSGLTPVNHSVLETALGREFLAMVPDLTGTAEVSEYVLTVVGEQAAARLF